MLRPIILRYKSYIAAIGALVVLFAPTIFINSAAWGQCDAIYAAFCLGSLYFLLKERPAWACTFFALALSFKLQAIFFFPVLLVLLLHERYFYLADVLSIIVAFYSPRTFYIAVGVQLCSLLSYAPYLLGTQVVSLTYIAFIVLVLVLITTIDLVFTLYPGLRERIVSSS